MMDMLQHPLCAVLPRPISLDGVVGDPPLVRYWLHEIELLWWRWIVVGAFLFLGLITPTRSRLALALLMFSLVVGNMALNRLLRSGPEGSRLRRASLFGTGLEWLTALGVIFTFSRDLATVAPAITLVLLLPTAVRYRLTGMCVAAGIAVLLFGLWIAVHLLLFDDLTRLNIWTLATGWLAVLVLLAALFSLVLLGGQEIRRWNQTRHESELAALEYEKAQCEMELANRKRQSQKLSRRQQQILPLLAQTDLSYNDIAKQLFVEPSTIKEHMERLERTLDVRGGRKAVVRAARERGILAAARADEPTDPMADAD